MRTASRTALALLAVVSSSGFARAYSGQVAFGQSTVEPAFDLATGDAVYLLTPDGAPLPAKANPRAQAPLYIVAYPTGTTIPATNLDCTPANCDHLQTLPPLPPELQGVYPGGQLAGHDHLVGVPPTGDFNVAWDVELLLFTPKGVSDGAINTRLTTWAAIQAAMNAGDLTAPIPTPIVFNCSIVSETVYVSAMAR